MMTAQQTATDASAYPHGPPPATTSATMPSSSSSSSSMSGNPTAATSTTDTAPKAVRADAAKPVDAAATAIAEDKPQPTKKSRRELPPHTVAILKGWMLSREHVKHPYPTDEDKQMLLKKTGISMKQLTNWFTNARKRIWKPMMRREHSRQMATALEYDKAGHRLPREFPGASLARSYGPTDATGPPGGYATERPSVRHSFDAGSLGPPPHAAPYVGHGHMQPQPHPQPQPQPHVATNFPLSASLYPPRGGRSMSEVPGATDMDDYIDAMRIRKRVHERGADDEPQPSEKRFRHAANSLSPRGLKVLQDWVAGRAAVAYPNDQERLQLAQDTGLDVMQVDGWIQSLHDHGASHSAAARPTTAALRSVPSRDNPQFSPPLAYRERRSIPSSDNPMFPPRPSVPSRDNPQFPPPPAVRAAAAAASAGSDRADGYYARYASGAAATASVGYSSGYDPARPVRSLSISTSQFVHQPQQPQAPAVPQPPGALPSLSSRNLMSRPAAGPTMGQPRDSRSRTLDMGQFADARRRKMTFQDILASTGDAVATSATATGAARSVVEIGYPNGSSAQPTATYATVATSSGVCGRCGGPEGGCGCTGAGEQASGR